jgi:pimeloyl-ACP methyl ester carboxylesterase
MKLLCIGVLLAALAAPQGVAWLAPRVEARQTTAAQATFAVGGGERLPAEFGEFTVPAVRHDPASPRLTLRYVRFRSTASQPKPPIVFLAGGPGDAATRAFQSMPPAVLNSLRAVADVIAFDQRGTGTSEPQNAMCPPGVAVRLDAPLEPAAYTASIRERVAACLPKLEVAGIRIAGFTTQESADDIEDLRKAIETKQVMLLAGSYGTHLALSAARRHPASISAMALLGVEGPDDTLKLPARVDAVLSEIDKTKPGLVQLLRTHIERLGNQPWSKTLPNGQMVTVGAWDLKRRVADALDTVAEIDALPVALAQMADGDYSDLVRWAIPFRTARPINVMNLAMDCASYGSQARLAAIRAEAPATLLGDAINVPLPDVCDTPGLPRLPDAFRAPLSSTIPTLLVSGTFDGRTPPGNAKDLAQSFARAELLVIPGASHSLFREPDALASVLRFFGKQ